MTEQAKLLIQYTNADGVVPTHAEAESNADSKSIVYRYTDAQGYVRLVSHFYQLYRPAGGVELAAPKHGHPIERSARQ